MSLTLGTTADRHVAGGLPVVAILVAFWAWCGLLCFPMIGVTED